MLPLHVGGAGEQGDGNLGRSMDVGVGRHVGIGRWECAPRGPWRHNRAADCSVGGAMFMDPGKKGVRLE